MAQTLTNRYKDLDISFRKNPANNDIFILEDIEAVKRSVKLLVMTNFNERLFHPEIGSGVYSSLFDNFGPETRIMIEKSIKDVIKNYEPRARVIKVDVKEDIRNHHLNITIFFYVINVEDPISIKINLERVR
jgi:phage baseplate assembly protein W